MNKKTLFVTVGLIVLVLIFGSIFSSKNNAVAPQEERNQEDKGSTPLSPSQTTPKKSTGGTTQPPPPSSTIKKGNKILTPLTGSEWVFGQKNIISWEKEAGISGGMALLDSQTRQTVGWILGTVGPHQTSYQWNAQEVSLSRLGGVKKDIGPDKYIIRITFDGPQPAIESGIFSIIYASQVKIPVHSISIKNIAFDPKSVTAKHGDKLVFTNNDTMVHRVLFSGLSPYTLALGESFTFDTSIFSAGKYQFYSDTYPSMIGTLTLE